MELNDGESELRYDAVVAGGGTSGCSAAYNLAKNGIKTLLIEKNNFLGGLMTGGLVIPVMKSAVSDINTSFYKKLAETAKKYGAQITYKDGNDGWFNPEILKIVLDEILSGEEVAANLDILFETCVSGVEKKDSRIDKLILKNDISFFAVKASYYIDATGSGELSALCGAEFINDGDIVQQSSLRFIVGNVDIERFCGFIKTIDNDENITNTYRSERDTFNLLNFTTASTIDSTKKWALDDILKKGVEEGLLIESDRNYFQIFSVAGSCNMAAFNCPRMNNYKNDPYKFSIELIKARQAIWRLFKFCKKFFPGFEKAEIVNIASQTGIREQRRVKTKYIYKNDDLMSGKEFETPVLSADYSVDVHSDTKNNTEIAVKKQNLSSYELPVESLISYDIENLFAAGKILGAEFLAHSALRVQKSCMQMGEGIAKYITFDFKNKKNFKRN